ncbi:MerR family transcriptional regulator [Streptomyces sp. NPDC020807]|uniref:MerR family transcriptional regulator n=1 Tax=Streptomyces sp. NPDC020807 TaxID=3155119 RepID=UPI0033C60C33
MGSDDLLSIGELATRAGVTVKTVRYYSDRGLLPEAGRSGGGHRRYGPEAVDRLLLIRSLRGLDLPVPEVERVIERDEALDEVLAGQLRELGSRLTAMRWREASLRLVKECAAGDRAERLRLVGAIALPPDTGALARFWRCSLPVRLPAPLAGSVLDSVIPRPPEDPTPEQVLAFARLHTLVTDPRLADASFRPAPPLPAGTYRAAVLYEGLREAYTLAAGARKGPGGALAEADEAVDCFVAAYARALGARDTPAFRRRLLGLLGTSDGPVIRRYWKLAAVLFAPGEPVLGALHHHLSVALAGQVAARSA